VETRLEDHGLSNAVNAEVDLGYPAWSTFVIPVNEALRRLRMTHIFASRSDLAIALAARHLSDFVRDSAPCVALVQVSFAFQAFI
jgi:hypothetical protein